MKIIPAILPSSYRAIEAGVQKVHNFTDTIQIDFVDGYFAPNRTWWFNNKDTDRLTSLLNQEEGLPEWERINYEFDLMVKDPLKDIDTFVALGPSKMIFHIASVEREELMEYFEKMPTIIKEMISFGIALGVSDDPNDVMPFRDHIDTIQCMGIATVGYQGQPFDERVLSQISKVKELFPDKNISVDGGVKLETAESLAQAGATSLVVGSLLFQNSDPEGIIRELKHICFKAHSPQEN